MNKTSQELPQFPQSYWRDSVKITQFNNLPENFEVDIGIIGAGITGITAAYLLLKEGFTVALIDAGEILTGTTAHTTAKLTAQHGLIYDELITNFGIEKARLYYEANKIALENVNNIVEDLKIDCDFSYEDAYLYTNDENYATKLQKEFQAYEKLGIQGELVETMPVKEVNFKLALKMANQAQFHPLKYLQKLVSQIIENGGYIFEGATATEVEQRDLKQQIIFRDGKKVTCKYVVQSSHYPFHDGLNFFPTRMYAERSYILAAKTKRSFTGGMYINAEQPARSLRSVKVNGEKAVLFVGENHKTGQGIDTYAHYEAVQYFAKRTFGIEQILYRWSAQDLTTLDKLPYVGRISKGKGNNFIATGFRKWGMTNGTAAAYLIKDLIINEANPYEKVVTPLRFTAEPTIKKFISTNVDVAKHLISGKLKFPTKSIADLSEGEGNIINFEGKRAGAYKDETGEIFIVDTTCTHLGCEVEWNNSERTWDCPCHGSRFSYKGEIINGPAEKQLNLLKAKK